MSAKTISQLLVIVLFVATEGGCRRSSDEKAAAISGASQRYRLSYVGYHREIPIIEGVLVFSIDGAGGVSGTWQLARTSSDSGLLDPGPQIGTGELIGQSTSDQIAVTTTAIADYDVLLQGKINDSGMTGNWSFRTDAGIEAQGTFVARPGR